MNTGFMTAIVLITIAQLCVFLYMGHAVLAEEWTAERVIGLLIALGAFTALSYALSELSRPAYIAAMAACVVLVVQAVINDIRLLKAKFEKE